MAAPHDAAGCIKRFAAFAPYRFFLPTLKELKEMERSLEKGPARNFRLNTVYAGF